MAVYKKLQLMSIILGTVLLILVLCTSISVNAQENIKVYNRNEEVILLHDLYCYNEQYYLHLDDLQQLGLNVSKDNNTYTITSSDCLGEERTIAIKPLTVGFGDIITPINELPASDWDSVIVDKVICSGTYKRRLTKTIGQSADAITLVPMDSDSFSGNMQAMIRINNELYISTQFVGSKLSHKYSLEDGRMDFYISGDSTVIMQTTINLVRGEVAPVGGCNVTLYTAYKTGAGNAIDDFEMLSSINCTIQENESNVTCLIETPAEKINDKNLYFIADLGHRYALAFGEYDFSNVGNILVYGQQKDVTYTVNVNLPAVDEFDVPFTVYVEADNKFYSKPGVVKGGEKSTIFEFEELPVARSYSTRIEFDYHKYKNALLEDFEFLDVVYAKDFITDFTAEYSRAVVCDVSLPDDFIPSTDVEVKVELSKFMPKGSLVLVDKLSDWTDSKIITLNSEKRSEQICLYSQASSSELSYKLISGMEGLCQNGYLHKGGKVTSDSNLSKEITESMIVDMILLQQQNITVNVFRPFSVSVDNDIFAIAELDDISTLNNVDVIMDFTQTPLISSGERKAQFELEVAEDKLYELKINNITGDDRLFDYYCHVKPWDSPADEGKQLRIGFSDDDIALTLLQCNNISARVDCAKDDLEFTALATCNLYNGEVIRFITDVENGMFRFKIPEDTDTYTLDVQTRIGKKSYYVSDGVSTNREDEATEIFFEYNDDKAIVIEYILQNPIQPIEISTKNKHDYFTLENVSDFMIGEYDAYVAYYDGQGRLISVDKTEREELISGLYFKLPRNTSSNYKIKKAKAFAWEKGSLTPLGNVCEISVNQPDTPEQNISIFKIGDSNAVINSKKQSLNKAPEEIKATMYISASDFERLGYTVVADEREVYIENDNTKYKFVIGEYTADLVDDDISYEISAPILANGEILVPVVVVCNLFEERTDWDNAGKVAIINKPFYDIEYGDLFFDAILDIYNRGVNAGYEDGSFQPNQTVLRVEAAMSFSRAMGHEFSGYEFECSDVTSEHWAKSCIGICINENIFDLENDMFRPDDCITVKETLIAALRMMGENFENYLEVAKEKGLLTNITEQNIERNVTRAEMAQILYNAMKIKG